MKTAAELAVYLSAHGLRLRVGCTPGRGWWASLRTDDKLSFEGVGEQPEMALERAIATHDRWIGRYRTS